MCAIVDANVVREVFNPTDQPPAGKGFFNWINMGKAGAHLVIGGRLKGELYASHEFKKWALEALRSGRLIQVEDGKVDAKTDELERDRTCRSNDPHVIALAQIGRVRLLYSNDIDLQDDFKDKALIDKPRGKVYSTGVNEEFTPARKRLLRGVFCAWRR